jgi:hypothetical protein
LKRLTWRHDPNENFSDWTIETVVVNKDGDDADGKTEDLDVDPTSGLEETTTSKSTTTTTTMTTMTLYHVHKCVLATEGEYFQNLFSLLLGTNDKKNDKSKTNLH